jgi:hypothetical protein
MYLFYLVTLLTRRIDYATFSFRRVSALTRSGSGGVFLKGKNRKSTGARLLPRILLMESYGVLVAALAL